MQSEKLPQGFPKYWDWRIHDGDALNPVKNQEKCRKSNCLVDMCWAIVAAEAFVARLKAKNYTDLLELSCQELLDSCQPKTEEQKSLAGRINGVIKINHKSEEELLMRVKEQPIAGCVMMSTTEFKLLKGDIYEGTNVLDKLNQDEESNSRHAILIIGFGFDENEEKNYQIVKNSYGKEWGIHGYGRIAQNSSLLHNKQNLIFRTYCPILLAKTYIVGWYINAFILSFIYYLQSTYHTYVVCV